MLENSLSAETMSFAEPIRNAVIEIASPFIGSRRLTKSWLTDERKDWTVIPELGVTLRWLLQTWGQIGRKNIHQDLWVKLAEQRALDCNDPVIFDDMRFPNEYDMIKRNGGLCIRIVRDVGLMSDANGSEGLLDDHMFDITVPNFGSLRDLSDEVGRVANDIRERKLR